MSSSTKIDIKKGYFNSWKRSSMRFIEHTLSAEKMYSINFTEKNKKLCLSLHYNNTNSYLFVNGTKIITFKSKNTEIHPYPLCLGNISKDWSVHNMKKNRI